MTEREKSRELLVEFTRNGELVAQLAKNGRHCTGKGERGLKRRAKKRRARRNALRLQRISWCAHYERLKKEASCSSD